MKAVVGLTLFVLATGVGALYVTSANRGSTVSEQTDPDHGERDPRGAASTAAATKETPANISAQVVDQDLPTTDDRAVSNRLNVDIQTRLRAEAATRRRLEQEVRDSYALLFDDLELTSYEQDNLFSFLIETRVAGVWTSYRKGTTLDPQDRANSIRAIIGRAKLDEFLALETHLASYWEVRRIELMLEQRKTPLTVAQRDGLFDVLVETRPQPQASGLGPDEAIQRTLARLEDRERHVIELAPSILAPQQVIYLHEQYQRCSYARAADQERQSRYQLDNPDKPMMRGYALCVF